MEVLSLLFHHLTSQQYNIAALDTKQNKQGLMMITEENLDSDCREIHYVR